jgi:acyl-coenzyme A thioesterase PaaI-like protein
LSEDSKGLFEIPEDVDAEWAARRRLADALRELSERCVLTETGAAQLEEAAALVQRATQLLPTGRTAAEAFVDQRYFELPARWIDRGAMSGRSNPVAPPMQVEMDGKVARCRIVLSERYVGAPGIVHGGLLAACFDQVCGHCAVAQGYPGLTVQLNIRYQHPAHVHTEILFEAEIAEVIGRQVTVAATCSREGQTLATGRAVFVILAKGQVPEIFGGG